MTNALIKINRILPYNRYIPYKDLVYLPKSSDIVLNMHRNQSLFDVVTMNTLVQGTRPIPEHYLLEYDFFIRLREFCNSQFSGFWTFRLFSGNAGNEIDKMDDILVTCNRNWEYIVMVYVENKEDHEKFVNEFIVLEKLSQP